MWFLDRLSEAPTHMAMSHDTALPGRYKADNEFSASW